MNYLSKEEVLAKLGLAPKPTIGQMFVSSLGPFGVGAILGAGVALLFAPKSGRKLREDIRTRVGQSEFINKMNNGEARS